MKEKLDDLIQICENLKENEVFKKYIEFIQFPFYRNLEIDTRITFDFPLTVFVGQNGCGKSSCLHALYGAPDRYTPYRFWFDTKVDPINYYDDKRKRHSFWYSFRIGKETKQVIKARIKRNNDPNYWETSRPLAWAGMETRKKRNDRDKPIKKNVVYLDFRSELSAFDKFFYFGTVKNRKSRNKQEFLRRKSSSLNKLFKGKKKTIYSSTRNLNEELEIISNKELEWISFILGRAYKSGISIKHRLFHSEGYSVLFSTEFASYSEAVAGSGEMAIVRLVREIVSAEKESLILLDEPEVFLHPGAQERLKYFLLEQIKQKKHQIVLTTHSPSLVSGLPKESIKVFYQNPSNGRFLIKENLIPEQAFFHLEYFNKSKINILVEDFLAKSIIDRVLNDLGEETKNLFLTKFNPGGETIIKSEFIKVFCQEKDSKTFVIFDGDQKPINDHLDWRNIPSKNLNTNYLQEKIKLQTGVPLKLNLNSNSSQLEKIELQKKILDYYLEQVYYLPKKTPEEIIWDEDLALKTMQLYDGVFNNKSKYINKLNDKNLKGKYAIIAKKIYGDDKSENIKSLHKIFLNYWEQKKNDDFKEIKGIFKCILEKI
ncbi:MULTISPECIES: ATP-dependent nuclease [Mesonia]|uniref:Uncharacterized protein n=1 Tax=Mesonia oceanica TaxID=2687242 RepID=A0AC61Y5I8_9FLAO|nr:MULTISPECIES: AAA family ATPase [Mesonia]MAN28977.1 hypothetical protein [Mesonia sp.]MAQ42757.1 hypothetical protein [Mesonia sp.]MBJ99295.1 hypothetical protein [Flavobacteriaceae bacterium]VVU99705.1 hypothetical protein FVB9532_00962 [Mesonia oceanica]|tara:strand:- start:59459 stop:61255 length:1797 start_codon:yes stop_codon:yes gene_type:complete